MQHPSFIRFMLGFLILGFGLITLSRPVHSEQSNVMQAISASASTEPPKIQRTLSIIKPDAVAENHIGAINQRFETHGLKIVAMKMIHLTPEQAGQFYAVHQSKPFFNELKSYMSSGPIVVQVLEGPHAIELNRTLMGSTDPKTAKPGTIRADFASSISANAVHGSDAPETAQAEINFFFNALEINS